MGFVFPDNVLGKLTVKIEGISGELLNNVRAYISLEEKKNEITLDETGIKKLYNQAPQEIRKALEVFGYYSPEIISKLETEKNDWIAKFIIQPGLPVIVKEVDFAITGEGKEDKILTSLIAVIKAGDPFNHGLYEKTKRVLLDAAQEHGFFDAHFTLHKVKIDRTARECVIILYFDTGPKYYFGRVQFFQEGFDDRYLQRFVPFKEGEPYSADKILALRNALDMSEHFTSVDISLRHELQTNRVIPVKISGIVRKKYNATTGIGYGTDMGMRGSLEWENRRVDGMGHRFKTKIQASQISKSIQASYDIPLLLPLTDKLSYQAGLREELTDTARTKTTIVGVKRSKKLRSSWFNTLFLDFQDEFFTVANEKDRSTLVIPGVNWTYTKADALPYPKKGMKLGIELKGSEKYIASSVSFLQAQTSGKIIRQLFGENRIFIRGEAGTTAVRDFNSLPPTIRFFTGGDNSVRGFGYNALAPKDENGNVIGGHSLLVGSIEYEIKLFEKLRISVFYDAGAALDVWKQYLNKGVGVGLRWRSPVGPIRIDLAFPITDKERNYRIHFNMEPDL
ncbi:MAG: autotransporter assembly complex family protein [bacterium]